MKKLNPQDERQTICNNILEQQKLRTKFSFPFLQKSNSEMMKEKFREDAVILLFPPFLNLRLETFGKKIQKQINTPTKRKDAKTLSLQKHLNRKDVRQNKSIFDPSVING